MGRLGEASWLLLEPGETATAPQPSFAHYRSNPDPNADAVGEGGIYEVPG
jgi:hypothetical protein